MISVVMPVYGVEQYIEQSLDSMLAQTEKNFELILVDDGSKDRSGQICDEYAKKDARIRVIHQANGGLCRARNAGLDVAQGDYIIFPDPDDWVDEHFLETLLWHMTPNGLSAVRANGDDSPFRQETAVTELTMAQAQVSILDTHGMQGVVWNKLFDVQLLRKNNLRFDPELLAEDFCFVMVYCNLATGKCFLSDARLYHYRQVQGSLSHNKFHRNSKITKFHTTEFEALSSTTNVLMDDAQVQEAFRQRLTRVAGLDVRTMQAHGMTKDPDYKKKVAFIRKHVIRYLKGTTGSRGNKLSVLLSAISPALELKVWELSENKRMGN